MSQFCSSFKFFEIIQFFFKREEALNLMNCDFIKNHTMKQRKSYKKTKWFMKLLQVIKIIRVYMELLELIKYVRNEAGNLNTCFGSVDSVVYHI